MLFFRNDYGQGCIPEIMEYMNTTNGHSFTGYGMDEICQRAKGSYKKHIPDYDVGRSLYCRWHHHKSNNH